LKIAEQIYECVFFEAFIRQLKIGNPKPVLSYVEVSKMGGGIFAIVLTLVFGGAVANAQ
jgi:hypothetical protein